MTKSKLIILISSIVAAIAIALTVTLIIVLRPKAEPSNNGSIGEARSIKIVALEGSATLTDGNEEIDCFKGMNLYDGDHIDVLDNSVLVARFDEDKYVYFGENTSINIKSSGKDKYKTNIFVEKGKVLAELINKLGEDEEFFLSSNNSVMAVRGTTFGVEVKDKGTEFEISYSVYKGVTELYAFDKKDGEIVSGKLVGLNNKKIELKVPKDSTLTESEFNTKLENWLENVDNKFDDETDANKELDEVEVAVTQPSKEDYEDVMKTISDTTISYSPIEYNAKSYYGKYDGLDHQITIDVATSNSKVQYKTEENSEYSDVNPSIKNPGSYRVYFKITSEGLDPKEDYAIVNIEKGDIDVEYKKNITLNGLIAGMNINNALAKINLFDYVNLKGAEADKSSLLESTFVGNDNLLKGTNSYKVSVILPDNIKDLYNDPILDISLTASVVFLESTNAISNGYASLDDINSFNKYNGVLEEELFGNPLFYVGSTALSDQDYKSVTFSYEYKTQGYYELKNGTNEVNVKIAFEDYEINTVVSFNYFEERSSSSIELDYDDFTITKLADDYYYFNTNDITVSNNNYQITGTYLKEHFGFGSDVYINLPTSVLDSNSDEYLDGNHTYSFPVDETSEIELLVYPNWSTKGTIKIISVYFSMNAPTNAPTYTIKPSLAYYPGTNLDFVISDSPVSYSLDNVTYQTNLTIDELGEYNVYFKVGDTVSIKGTGTVLITTGGIESDGLSLISNQIYVLTTDGVNTNYKYNDGSFDEDQNREIASEDGTAVSPLDDIYEIYTNIIKNATYYNNVTHEEIEVEVSITRIDNSPNFSYEIMADGYASLRGSVNFNYVYEGTVSGKEPSTVIQPTLEFELMAANPADLTVSLSDVDRVYASRPVFSAEERGGDYEILYSYDEGKTWVDESPEFTTVGQYKVYSIYRGDFSDLEVEDFLIISIQNITITE